ncbi:chemotaxis protein CheA [Acidithiobacillus thiooxidans]|uniref:Chemotaxis protein CheA n=1 Tax=Acidithiobacillus thiooxidans TaxID=930 RepID=A0A1C2JAP1_ACITH|nr:chemotaxis protein CheA [Acidithiobacillus thiooxidans]OCX69830.1 chemotaxis protein CheA [Acidithiobacillus thiooxidans]OCX70086.1 chemotaxis protein CheA [Acidithiobacillus thiooxidans]OCX85282.1 chemotaxis protein CheA [Acidithiobacillus thiooxidans]OCX86608.1 chemotaxis protein CheA [Acidithiobacillus thiooxidans]OFC42672.1 chemotaxis protein CheA [Acidithiobacillus thiooxidans]
MDKEILQDFLPEATELLENAQTEALSLENHPDDTQAIAALFRAFHTLKGGAGFLEAVQMVEWCHHLEDLLDKVRSGKLRFNSQMSDVVLQGLDVIQGMLEELRQGEYPSAGPADLGKTIQAMASGSYYSAADETQAEQYHAHPTTQPQNSTSGEVRADPDPGADCDAAILYVEQKPQKDGTPGIFLQQETKASADHACSAGASDLITEEEFERYLDQLQAGKKNTANASADVSESPAKTSSESPFAEPPTAKKTIQPVTAGHPAENAESTLRVDAARLDAVMNQVGEMVLLRNRFAAAVQGMSQESEDMVRIVREMDLTVNDMQNTVMQLRMQPCKRLFQQLPRVVRDVSRQLGKQVDLVIEGEDVEIDKKVVDALSAPLVHLVRNSMDHGIEIPADRKMLGKPETATLRVAALHLGDKVRIEVSDDGQGIDRQMVVRKAVEKSLITPEQAARLSDQEAIDLIFRPGFSTNDTVTEFSGRGVGMDVVKETTHQLRGRLDVHTEPGRGTTIAMEFPLTLAVLPVLYLRLRREIYAVPISAVESLLDVDPAHIHQTQGQTIYQVGNQQVVPLLDLGTILHGEPLHLGNEPTDGILTERGLLVVSEVLGNEDSVVKPVDFMPDQNWYQGATISGKGNVVLILDVGTLMRRSLDQSAPVRSPTRSKPVIASLFGQEVA